MTHTIHSLSPCQNKQLKPIAIDPIYARMSAATSPSFKVWETRRNPLSHTFRPLILPSWFSVSPVRPWVRVMTSVLPTDLTQASLEQDARGSRVAKPAFLWQLQLCLLRATSSPSCNSIRTINWSDNSLQLASWFVEAKLTIRLSYLWMSRSVFESTLKSSNKEVNESSQVISNLQRTCRSYGWRSRKSRLLKATYKALIMQLITTLHLVGLQPKIWRHVLNWSAARNLLKSSYLAHNYGHLLSGTFLSESSRPSFIADV